MSKMMVGWIVGCLILAPAIRSQGKTSIDAEKQKVAVMPFDVVKIANSVKGRSTYEAGKEGVKYESTPDDVFADLDAVKAFGEAATQKVVNAFVKLSRFSMLERSAIENLIKEQDFQMSDNVSEAVVNAGGMAGARYICQGQLQQVSSTELKDPKKGKPLGMYTATVEIQIRIIDVETGEITASKDVKGTSGTALFGVGVGKTNRQEACYDALNDAEKDIYKWLTYAFPVEGEIFEINKTSKKEGATRVTITVGKDIGVRKGDSFRVYIESEVEVAGKMRKKTTDVGKLSVKSVNEDGWSSICEVEKGGKDIQQNIDSGVKLMVVQTKK